MLQYLRASLKDDTSIIITNLIRLSSRTHVQTILLSLVVPIIKTYKYKSVHGEKYNAITVTFVYKMSQKCNILNNFIIFNEHARQVLKRKF